MTLRILAAALLALIITAGALSGCGRSARANGTTLTWELATAYEDGSPLAANEIEATRLQWGPRGGPYNEGAATVPAPATTHALPALRAGESCFVAFTVLTEAAAAAKPSARESRATAEVCAVVPFVPNAPSGLRVQ
jgi:hypothetical protein